MFKAVDEAVRANISSVTVSDEEIMSSSMVSEKDLSMNDADEASNEIGDVS